MEMSQSYDKNNFACVFSRHVVYTLGLNSHSVNNSDHIKIMISESLIKQAICRVVLYCIVL